MNKLHWESQKGGDVVWHGLTEKGRLPIYSIRKHGEQFTLHCFLQTETLIATFFGPITLQKVAELHFEVLCDLYGLS